MKKERIIEILASLLALLFVYAAISKLIDFRHFSATLTFAPLIGKYATVAAIGLPIIELGIVALLLFPDRRKLGLWLSAQLLVVFTIYLTLMLLFAKHIPCACGGLISKMTWKQHIVFNFCFLMINIVALRLYRGREETSFRANLSSELQ